MGFEISGTHLIFFIGAVVIASTLVGIFTITVYNIQSGIDARGSALTLQLETDINIINDPANFPTNNTTIYVKNIGRTRLNKHDISVIIDGFCLSPADYNITVLGGYTFWDMNAVIRIEIIVLPYRILAPGEHTVKVSINGQWDSMKFII